MTKRVVLFGLLMGLLVAGNGCMCCGPCGPSMCGGPDCVADCGPAGGPGCGDCGPACGACGPSDTACGACGACGPRPGLLACVFDLFGCGCCGDNGCGPKYWGECCNDQPDCCDPCDRCGNWSGRPGGPYGGGPYGGVPYGGGPAGVYGPAAPGGAAMPVGPTPAPNASPSSVQPAPEVVPAPTQPHKAVRSNAVQQSKRGSWTPRRQPWLF